MKRLLSFIFAFVCLSLGAWAYSSGDGSASRPYTIANKSDFQQFVSHVNKGRMGVSYATDAPDDVTKGDMYGCYFKLTADIVYDGSENNYEPAGFEERRGTSVKEYYFHGTFDGDGHTISGINVTSDASKIGIFGFVSEATIKNLTVANSYFSGASSVGAIVGEGIYAGTIENCQVMSDVTVKAWQQGGGVVGWCSEANLYGCASEATVNCQSGSAGGVVGQMVSGSLTDCLYIGDNVSGASNVGALIGTRYYGIGIGITNCYYTSNTLNPFGNRTSNEAFQVEPVAASNAEGSALKTYLNGIAVYRNGILYKDNFYSFFSAIEGSGTSSAPYIIPSAEIWDMIGNYINKGGTTDDKYYQLASDITVTTSWGDLLTPFRGHFDGNKKTLTVNISNDTDAAAPFKYVWGISNDVTIKNLHVKGVANGGMYSAGLVGFVFSGTCLISNCHVGTAVTCTGEGNNDAHGGGIVGYAKSSSVALEGCLFDGTITATSNGKGNLFVGAMIGWCDSDTRQTLKRCVEDGTYVGCTNINLFYDDIGFNIIQGTFHVNTAISQGALAKYAVTSSDNLTVTLLPTPTNYDVAGFSFYGNVGVFYKDTNYFIAGSSMQFSAEANEDNIIGAVYANNTMCDYDSESETYGFTMPAESVLISADMMATGWDGEGTAEAPWLIYDAGQLKLIATRVNSASGDNDAASGYRGKYFKVMADIDFDARENNFTPIGTHEQKFNGHFDGNAHVISGIRVNTENPNNGIFGEIGSTSNVTGVILANSLFRGFAYTGGIVGRSDQGTVSNCHVLGTVTLRAKTNNSAYFGGIVGYSYGGTIDNCTSAATLSSKNGSSYYTPCHYYGGIAGAVNYGTVTNSVFLGNIQTLNIKDAVLTQVANAKLISNCFYTNNTLTSKCGTLAPHDNIDNRPFIKILADRSTMFATNGHSDLARIDFKINGRTFFKDGDWNTVTLPFDLTLAGSVLDGATVRTMSDASFQNNTLTLNFNPVETLTAGTPYLVKWSGGKPGTEGVTYTVTSSNQWDSGNYRADHLFEFDDISENIGFIAFDPEAKAGYYPESNANWYVEFKTSEPLPVISYTLMTPASMNVLYALNCRPKTWTLSAKLNEDDDWTVIDVVEDGQLPEEYLATKTYDLEKAGIYQYFRFNATETVNRAAYFYGYGYNLMILKHLWLNVPGGPVADLTFNDVLVTTADIEEKTQGNIASFTGNYAPVTIEGTDRTILFIGEGNNLYYPDGMDLNAKSINPFRAFFMVKSFVGDVNGDGVINVTDVTLLVNNILGIKNDKFIFENADVNGDNVINVSDVTALVNIILLGRPVQLNVVFNGAEGISFGGGDNGDARAPRHRP